MTHQTKATTATTRVHGPGFHVCFDNDLGDDWLRKHPGKTARDEVLAQVREFGGFSVFWVTANQPRARAADLLANTGVIVGDGESPFPWNRYKIAPKTKRARKP
jgi:hypothetical protein